MRAQLKDRLAAAGYLSELDWHDAPEEALRAICEVSCYDGASYYKRMRLKNSWYQLVNTHLILEHVAQEFLVQELPNYQVLNLDRWGLLQKIELILALGRIGKDQFNRLKFINSIRNKAAHKYHFEITKEVEQQFRSHFPKGFWDMVGHKSSFAKMLIVSSALFEADRQESEFRSLRRKGAFANVTRVLGSFEKLIAETPTQD